MQNETTCDRMYSFCNCHGLAYRVKFHFELLHHLLTSHFIGNSSTVAKALVSDLWYTFRLEHILAQFARIILTKYDNNNLMQAISVDKSVR